MDGQYFVIGIGSILLGVTDASFAQGMLYYLGIALIVLGIAVCVKGVFTDSEDIDYDAPMPPELPGRLCDHCGKMTSLDSSTCQHCGASLIG